MCLPKYTSIGCYPLFYVTSANVCLCPECAEEERDNVQAEINWESQDLYCDECSETIESAY